MVVTSLERKGKSFYNVVIDEDEVLQLHIDVISDNRLKVGTELTFEDIEQIKRASDYRRGKERALYLIEYRDHSSSELYDKLCDNISCEVAAEVVERMQEIGLIDDERYSENLFLKLKNKGYGPSRIKNELYRKGIDKDLIDLIFERHNDFDYVDDIVEIIKNKYLRFLSDDNGKRKVASALIRLGYSWQDIKTAMRSVLENVESD